MKKTIIAVLFCFLLPVAVNAENLVYLNPQNHYTFTLPSGWVEVPKSTIDETMHKLADQTDGQFINYVAGFQLEGAQPFQYPYILIQEHEINTPSYGQITEILGSNEFSVAVNKKTDEYSELMTNASLQTPFVDKERSIIFMNLEMDVTGVGKIKGLMAMVLGKKSITQLNFYSIKSEYSKNLSTFNQIIDSFKYEQGYKYNAEEAKKNDSPSIFEGVVGKGITGAVSGGLIALVFTLFSRLNKKKKKEKNKNCMHCGERVLIDSEFCTQCGKKQE